MPQHALVKHVLMTPVRTFSSEGEDFIHPLLDIEEVGIQLANGPAIGVSARCIRDDLNTCYVSRQCREGWQYTTASVLFRGKTIHRFFSPEGYSRGSVGKESHAIPEKSRTSVL